MDRSYIAGLFDGEGYFTFKRCKVSSRYTVRPYRYQAYGNITIREEHLLQKIVDTLGYGWCSPLSPETDRHAAYYIFGVTGKNLKRFCEEIGPYLIIKKDRAKLIHEICEIKEKIGNKSVDDDSYSRQEKLWLELKELNRKGPKGKEAFDGLGS